MQLVAPGRLRADKEENSLVHLQNIDPANEEGLHRYVYLLSLRNSSDDPVNGHRALCGQHQAVVALALRRRAETFTHLAF